MAISAGCLAFVISRIDLLGAWRALQAFEWPFLVAAILSLAVGYLARIVRWSTMLRADGAKVPAIACAAPFLGSIALNNILPLRIGDVVRALVFPNSIGVSRTTAVGSIVLERLVDLATLIACLMVGVAYASRIEVPPWVSQGAVALAIVGVGGLVLLLLAADPVGRVVTRISAGHSSKAVARIGELGGRFLASIAAMTRLTVVLKLLSMSLLVWAGEAGVFFFVLKGFEGQVDMAGAIVVMAIATIATLVPSSPGYVGPFHAAAFAAAAMLGDSPEAAASFAVVVHLTLWLPTTLAGGIAILLNPGLFSGIQSVGSRPDGR
jgi:uncharacterized protein (TIRG00374 family)